MIVRSGLFVAEGSSDAPLANVVEGLFHVRGVPVQLTRPDFALISDKVDRDVASRVAAGLKLMEGKPLDIVVIHRDVDATSPARRRAEITTALSSIGVDSELIAILPVRMSEAWLLLDEDSIRAVAGNPRGRNELSLPTASEVERIPDPKQRLRNTLRAAADVSGRRRQRFDRRFASHRRQLMERLDVAGAVNDVPSWRDLISEIDAVAARLGEAP